MFLENETVFFVVCWCILVLKIQERQQEKGLEKESK